MYVGLKNIMHCLSAYPTYLTASDQVHCLTGWDKLATSSAPYSPHVLYVCKIDEIPADFYDAPDTHLLCFIPENTDFESYKSHFQDHTSVLFLKTSDPHLIHTELQNYYNIQSGVGMYGQTLFEFLSFGDSLQNAIDYSYRIFMNPIFVFDTNNNLIAATWDAIEKLGMNDDVISNKGFSNASYKLANKNHFHERVAKSDVPIKKYNEELGYEQLICAINTQKNLGHIVVAGVNKPLEPIDDEFLLMLKKFINQVLTRDSFIRNAKGFNYEYFLKDLLDQKITADKSFSDRTEYVQKEFFGNLYCLVVEAARSIDVINAPLMRNILESRFPNSKVLIYNGQIVCIISLPKNNLMPQEYRDNARKICKEHGLFAGLSNCFQNILDLSEYYNQALRSIELGIRHSNEADLFCYDDYYMDHVINTFLQKGQPRAFSHPKMQFLLDYDAKHKSELAYTLYMYLIHERNLAAASEAMNMHRTSLVYRFKKINSLIGDDFDSYQERMHMILSYEMYKH